MREILNSKFILFYFILSYFITSLFSPLRSLEYVHFSTTSLYLDPSLNTQSANADHINHYSAVPSSAFNATTVRRSTGQHLVNPRPFNSQNVPITPTVMTNFPFMVALMPYAVCFFPLLPHFSISDVAFSSSSQQDQISLIQPGDTLIFIILRCKPFSSAFKTCSFLFLLGSTLYLSFLLGNRLEIS
jgi:hypothetical protein